MNHLAHIFLSGNNDNLVIGNYIADYTRGNNFSHLPKEIQRGIQLHRAIDTFTDGHPEFRAATKLVRPDLQKFSGVAMDIFFDYFLASKWENFHSIKLEHFSENVYQLIERKWEFIPEKGRRFYSYMVAHNLLVNYQNQHTLSMVFKGIDSRTKFDTNLHLAVDCLQNHHIELEQIFNAFFSDLMNYVNSTHD